MELKEKVHVLNQLIIRGDTVKAMEIYYADEVEMQENEDAPRKGKSACMSAEQDNLKNVAKLECRLLNQAIDAERNVVFSEWSFIITRNDDTKLMLTEVSVQHWENGQVAREKFYYKEFHKAGVQVRY